MMRKMLLAAALSVTAMTAHADYQCSVTPRDDVIVSPQTVQVKGENGNLVIRFDEYEVGPGSMGSPAFEIPRSVYESMLKEGY